MTRALGLPLLGYGFARVAAGASGVLVGLVLADAPGGAARAGTAGAIGAAGFAAEILAAVPLGLAADVVALRRLVTAGAVLGLVGVAIAASLGSVAAITAARLLEGIGSAAVAPALLAYFASATDGQAARRARLMSLFELTLVAGLAFGGLLGAVLFRSLHAAGFAALTVLYAGAATVFALQLPAVAVSTASTRPFGALRAALHDRALRRLAAVWLCVNAIAGVWLGPALPFLLTQRHAGGQVLAGIFAADASRVGWLLFGYAVVFAAGVLLWSIVLPRISVRTALVVSLVAILPASALLAFINHTAPAMQRAAAVVALALVVVVESGFTPAALTRLASALPAAGRGGTMGFYALLLGIGEICGSLLAGAAGTWMAIDGLIVVTAILALLALALVTRLDRAA